MCLTVNWPSSALFVERNQHRHGAESPISTPTRTHILICRHTLDCSSILHRTTGYAHSSFKRRWQSTVPLCLSNGIQHHLGEASPISTRHVQQVMPISTPPAQRMIGTERLHMGINDASAGCSSTCHTVLQCNTDHDTTGLCVTFGGIVDMKSR